VSDEILLEYKRDLGRLRVLPPFIGRSLSRLKYAAFRDDGVVGERIQNEPIPNYCKHVDDPSPYP
jgi:hypothetical protein